MSHFSSIRPEHRGNASSTIPKELFAKDLQESIRLALPPGSCPYSKVVVLMVTWEHLYEETEGGLRQDFDELRSLFEDDYGYEIVTIYLNVAESLTTTIRNLIKRCVRLMPLDDQLLIFYYVGHGAYDAANRQTMLVPYGPTPIAAPEMLSGPSPILVPTEGGNFAPLEGRIDFQRHISNSLDYSSGQVLYLMDTCHSASAGIHQTREVLAASNIETQTMGRSSGGQSFTQALCMMLRRYPAATTAAEVHAKLVYHYFEEQAGVNLHATPVHVADTRPNIPSITIAPLRPKAPQTQSQQPAAGTSDKLAKVIIRVSLSDKPPKSAELANWLRSHIPEGVQDIEVEGIFSATSCKVLLRIPVQWWDLLPDRSCYAFVDYVAAPNLVVSELKTSLEASQARVRALEAQLGGTRQQQQTLPVGRGRGRGHGGDKKENIRPGGSGFGNRGGKAS